MSNNAAALLALLTIGGIGVALILAAIIIKAISTSRIAKCTEMVEGRIVKHKFFGEGRIAPVVEFTVNDKVYRTVKKFNGFKEVRRMPSHGSNIWENENGYLCIKGGAIIDMGRLANEMFPIGAAVSVFYAPSNPKINYVDRPTRNSFVTKMFTIMGLFLVALGVIMFFVIK